MNKGILWLCLAASLLLSAVSANGQTIALDSSDYTCSDISVMPMLPVQGEETIVRVKVHNRTDNPIANVVVAVSSDKARTPVGRAVISLPPSGTGVADIKWLPQGNGWHKLTVSAERTAPQERQTAGLNVPVTARRLFFPWFGEGSDLRYANIVTVPWNKPERHDYWLERGAMPCFWKGVYKTVAAEEYKQILYKNLPDSKVKGILIDEMGGYSDTALANSQSYAGLRSFTEEHPDIFVGLWVAGSLKPSVANLARNPYRKKGVDLLMLESYCNYQVTDFGSYNKYAYFDQRINTARDQDVLGSSVMTLSLKGYEDKYTITPADLEDQVRYIRRAAPEMPGVGFFSSDAKTKGLVPFADSLALNYYIKPVINIWERDITFSNNNPAAGERVSVEATIYNIGGMDAGEVTVNIYGGDPRYGGRRISGTKLASIPADPCKRSTPPSGKAIVRANWRAVAGYHDIWVEVIPRDRNATLLDGLARRTIYVRGTR